MPTLMPNPEESGSPAAHDWQWARIFEFERSSLSLWLAVFPEDIEHIGSSAVPNPIAGDVLDIMVGVDAFPPPPHFLKRIARMGYTPVKRPTIPDQFEFALQGPPKIELHVVAKGGDHWNNNIALREFLKTNDSARARFQWPRQDGPPSIPAATPQAVAGLRGLTSGS